MEHYKALCMECFELFHQMIVSNNHHHHPILHRVRRNGVDVVRARNKLPKKSIV